MNVLTRFRDRIQLNSLLIVLSFVSVLALSSQSAASYATYFLAIAMLATVRQWNDVFAVRLSWWIFALVGYLTLSVFWSEPFVWRDAASIFVRSLLVVLFVIAFAECQLRGLLQLWLGRALAVVGSIATLIAIVAFFVTDPSDGRLNGMGQLDTHVVAALVYGVVLIFVLEVLMKDDSVGWRYFALVSAALIGIAVLLSDSRNAWVSVVFGVLVFLMSHRTRDVHGFVSAAVAIAIVIAVVILALITSETVREVLLPRNDSYRLLIWTETLKSVWSQGPIFGVGILSPDEVITDRYTFFHPHNMYLAVLHQGGLVGLLLFVALLGSTISTLLAHYDNRDAKLALGVLAIALPAYVLDGHELVDKVGETWYLFWLPVAIGLGLRWNPPLR